MISPVSESENDQSLWDRVTESVSETYDDLTGSGETAERVPHEASTAYETPASEAAPSYDTPAADAPPTGEWQPEAAPEPAAPPAEDPAVVAQQQALDECDSSITSAKNAMDGALSAISAVPAEYYGGYGNEWQDEALREALDKAKHATHAASGAAWNAYQTCSGVYGGLYDVYNEASEADTSIGTAQVSGTSYQRYCDAASNHMATALGKLPW